MKSIRPRTPSIPKSKVHVALWLTSLLKREDPACQPVDKLGWHWAKEGAFKLPWRFVFDGNHNGILYAGVKPEFVSVDEVDPGSATFRLKTPCVVLAWTVGEDKKIFTQAVVVTTVRSLALAKRTVRQLEPSELFASLSALTHLTEQAQREIGTSPTGPKPTRPTSLDLYRQGADREGRDPDGDV